MIRFRGRCKPDSMIEGLIHIENAEEGHAMTQEYRGMIGTWTFQPDTPDSMVPAVFTAYPCDHYGNLLKKVDRLEKLLIERGYVK